MRNLMLAGAAALSMALVPATASADDHMAGEKMEMTEMQKADYDSWDETQRTAYDGWDLAAQQYYWTLSDAERGAWWMLTNDQRMRVMAMTPTQRTAAWSSIMAQVNGTTTPAATTAAADTTATSEVRYVSNEMAQTTPMAEQPSEYPVCSKDVQDSCINSWAVNKTGTKPLDYWPGKPASEM